MEAETEANHGVSFADALRVWGDADRPLFLSAIARLTARSGWIADIRARTMIGHI